MKLRGSGRMYRCPRCGYRFEISYARTFACGGCPSAVSGCGYVKCPSCGHEWPA